MYKMYLYFTGTSNYRNAQMEKRNAPELGMLY